MSDDDGADLEGEAEYRQHRAVIDAWPATAPPTDLGQQTILHGGLPRSLRHLDPESSRACRRYTRDGYILCHRHSDLFDCQVVR